MKIQPIKTSKVQPGDDLLSIIDQALPTLAEGTIVAITSKIVSICEDSVIKVGEIVKEQLIAQEADYYLPAEQNQYGIVLTIKGNTLIPSAGIDESNANGYYVLWPKDPQQTANMIRSYLIEKFKLQRVGIIITDSKTTPLRWGTTGVALVHSGFRALRDYRNTPDIYDVPMRVTQANVADGLAAAAVLVMGEGAEQTPIALVEDLPFVEFQDRDPSAEELAELAIDLDEDIYAPVLRSVAWQPGGRSVGG